MLRKILQPFYTAYVFVVFLITILAAFPFFVIISLGNNLTSRRIVFKIIEKWTYLWLWLIGMPLRRVNEKPAEGKFIIVANHISYLDPLVLFPAVPGYFRPLGKIEIAKIPVVGFIYKQVTVMIDRSSMQSRSGSLRALWKILHTESSIVIFPEGTFNETTAPLKDFYDGAFRLAINTQTDILPMIFPDTVHRWNYKAWWKFWPGENRVIYIPRVEVSGMTMADLPVLKQKVYDLMDEVLVKYKVK